MVIIACIVMGSISVSNAFSDMPKEHWAYDKVEEMTSKGIITGYADGTFKPEKEVTREEFATILTKTLELETVGEVVNFRDVDSSRWSKQYIDASSRYLTGYLNNGNYYFYPESYAVREDMAVAVVKARGLDNETPNYSVLDRFSDKDKISENLKKYIAIAVENGIMLGNENGTFNPLGNLTRAEITALMCNVLEKVVIEDGIIQEHVHKLQTKYIYKSETSHTEEIYCKICGEVTESKTKVHSYTNEECKCGYEIEHKHQIRINYIYKNETSHIEEEYCSKCEEVIGENSHSHEYENGKCVCGAEEEIIYGDANNDGKVNENDVVSLLRYIEGLEEQIDEKNADVFIDGKIDAMDSNLITRYITKLSGTLTHDCGSYQIEDISEDTFVHEITYLCKCGGLNFSINEAHNFVNGKCVCGAEEEM